MDNQRVLRFLRLASLIWLLLLAVFWSGFALLSGAEQYGGGIEGILRNSPNAIPWLLLLAVALISFKWPLSGAVFCALFGLFSLVQFDAFESPMVLLTISLPLFVISALLFVSRLGRA